MPNKRSKRLTPLKIEDLVSLSFGGAVRYVQKLHEHIAKQNKRIGKLKLQITKLKFLSKLDQHLAKTAIEETKEAAAKTQNNGKSTSTNIKSKSDQPKVDEEQAKQETVLDFVNEIKAQAEINTWNQAGFVYEPTSGLYYDTKTGYYYNPQYDLYYNGNDGNWYRLNPRTKEFTFHSGQTSAQQQNQKNDDDVDDTNKNELDEEAAIRKILEEGRKPSKVDEKEKSRRRYYSDSDSSHSSSASSDHHRSSRRRRNRYRSISRSRSRSSSRHSKRRASKKSRRSRSPSAAREEGECESSDSSASNREESHYRLPEIRRKRNKKKKGNEYEEIAKKYPPSLRLVVIESDKLDAGKLFVVTYKGGTLGREGSHHIALIPDVNVSKNHLRFSYDKKRGNYQIVDQSRNGTLIDGRQVSLLSQEDSEPSDLFHENILQLSNTKLLCHIHEGLTTCKDCEPFNYAKPSREPEKVADDPLPSNLSHKEQKKLLQKRYGLQSEKYQENALKTNSKYEDRAEKRRVNVGSSHDSEKVQQASVDTSISSDNKGFKMLSKMGWKEGKSIGKSQEGIVEPVQVKAQQGTSGLGVESVQLPSTSSAYDKKKRAILSKTQQRYNNIASRDENIFGD